MTNIEKIFEFLVEIEKLKNVIRKTKPVALDRYENSAEHSWHVCLSALLLSEYSNAEIDLLRVIKMLLIHDLGEIDAGDTIVYSSDREKARKNEAEGVKRLLSMLPKELAGELQSLWNEFADREKQMMLNTLRQ